MNLSKLLQTALQSRWINKTDNILVVCGSNHDDEILKKLGFSNVLITSAYDKLPNLQNYKKADAQNLPYKDESFNIVLVNLGLHHCASPHLALCEMYRVARKTIIVHEAQDSFMVKLMSKLSLISNYEIADGKDEHEGKVNTSIVNYVYRWTRREVRKTLNSYDPVKNHKIIFLSNFTFHQNFLGPGGYWEKKFIVRLLGKRVTNLFITLITKILNTIMPNHGNDFSFVIRKRHSSLQSWAKHKNYFKNRFKQTIIKK